MTDHAAAALLSLQAADEMPGIASAEYHHREALVHATLEQAKWLHEIVSRLDSMPLLPIRTDALGYHLGPLPSGYAFDRADAEAEG